MMRKNNNRNNMKHRSGGGGGGNRSGRYQNNGGNGGNGGNRGANDGQNIQRQKHHATQQLGKYSDMARNAQINGDRVDVEYYLQHVDHYTRVLADIATIEAERYAHQREQQIVSGGPNDPNANTTEQGGGEAGAAVHESGGQQGGEGANAEFDNNNQPRMTRQPRRQHYSNPQEQPSGNGAQEANSNTTEIPLPGGILPPI